MHGILRLHPPLLEAAEAKPPETAVGHSEEPLIPETEPLISYTAESSIVSRVTALAVVLQGT